MRAWWFCALAFGPVLVCIRLACADYPLYWDEWISIFFARLPTAQLWSDWAVNESNPPLYYSLLKAWLSAFGWSPCSARMLSVAGGLCAAGVLSLCSHRAFGIWGAVTTWVICALSSQAVFYSLFVRAYVFVLLAFAVSLLGMLIALAPGASPCDRRRGLVLYAAGAVAAVYLHTTMLLWPVVASIAVGASMVADRGLRRILVPWIVANLSVAALSAWWIYITLQQVAGGAHWVVWNPPMTAAEYISNLRQSIMLLKTNAGIFKPASYLLALVACVPLLKRDRTAVLIGTLLLAAIAVFFAAQLIKPIIYQKTLWWMTGLVIILVSGAIAGLRTVPLRLVSLALLAGLLIADLVVARPGFTTHDWSGLARFAASHRESSLVMLNREAGVIFDEACRAEFKGRCPVRFVVVLREPGVTSWEDEYAGPLLLWAAGQPVPVNGPVYLLRDGLARDHWTVSSSREYHFGTLRVIGPAPLGELVRPR